MDKVGGNNGGARGRQDAKASVGGYCGSGRGRGGAKICGYGALDAPPGAVTCRNDGVGKVAEAIEGVWKNFGGQGRVKVFLGREGWRIVERGGGGGVRK